VGICDRVCRQYRLDCDIFFSESFRREAVV
jgi:hypothetical protein